jgi:hypothetical protein
MSIRNTTLIAAVLVFSACHAHGEEELLSGAVSASPVSGAAAGAATFGQACSSTVGCAAGLACVTTEPGATTGVCTKECAAIGEECADAPGSSVAVCGLNVTPPGKLHCGFLCKVEHGDHVDTFSCPSQLRCPEAQTADKVWMCQPR